MISFSTSEGFLQQGEFIRRNYHRFIGQYIDAGIVVVTKENIDTYARDVQKITDGILAELKTKYLNPPK